MPRKGSSKKKDKDALDMSLLKPVEREISPEMRAAMMKKIATGAVEDMDKGGEVKRSGDRERDRGSVEFNQLILSIRHLFDFAPVPYSRLDSKSQPTTAGLKMEGEEPTGYIALDKFSEVAMRILTSSVHSIRDSEEVLYRAFLTLDVDKKGYLLPEELRNYLTSDGEPLTKEEMEEMLL
ncbi:Dynein regulatory complex protein 8, partial [Quaeritorhiza haematococci]